MLHIQHEVLSLGHTYVIISTCSSNIQDVNIWSAEALWAMCYVRVEIATQLVFDFHEA